MPQPTLSEAHLLSAAFSKLRSGCASACMEKPQYAVSDGASACGICGTRETPGTLETLETLETLGGVGLNGEPPSGCVAHTEGGVEGE